MPLSITVINPIFTDVNSFAHTVATSIQRDDVSGEVIVQTAGPAGQFPYGVAVFNSAGTLLRSGLVSAGTTVPDTSVPCQFGIAPGGSKILGATPNGVFAEASFFQLNRTTFANTGFVTGWGQGHFLAVSPGEVYAATFGKIYSVANNSVLNTAELANTNAQVFSSDSMLWFGQQGKLLQYSVSGNITATKLNTFTPVNNGANISALSYLPQPNVLVLWYDNGDIYTWDVGSNQILAKVGTFSPATGGFAIQAQLVSANDKADNLQKFYSNYTVGSAGNIYVVTPFNKAVNVYARSLWNGPLWTEALTLYEPTGQNIWANHRSSNDGPFAGLELLPLTNPAPAEPTPPPPVYGAQKRTRAWTFTLDGHTFYVLDLYTEGTFVFDTVSNRWAKFSTQGYGAWNMHQGTMWGKRIVAGDIGTSQVWELDPAAMLDEGFRDITHAVTGALVTRSRTYHAVDAVRVSASAGDLDEVNGATFNLRFSDDQGNTWSPYFSLTLSESDFSGEIAWRSLGSFNAPGRIFELTDSGGLVRIDGCDAFIDDFDNDAPQESQQ